MLPRAECRFAFDDFVLDLDRRELRRGGEAVSLGPQVFDLLVHLVRHRDRVVSKDDLLETVWKGRIVSDSTLTSHVNAVRKALGDSGEAQRLIRTVPRKGLRFVGEVRAEDVAIAEAPPASFERPAIAVLPFTNMGGDTEQEYFADGITEDIITALAKWRSLLVIARNSTFAYKGRSLDVRQIGRELGARYVLEGSVRRSANRVRVTAQLIDAANAAHLWAERYDRELTDIFAIQDEISRHIATVIEPELGRYERTQSAARPPANLDAWDCLHRGLHLLYKFTRADIEAARTLLARAVALDPNLARAETSLAYTYQADLVHGFSDNRPRSIELLLEHARRGVELDDSDSYSHVMLAFGYRWAKNYELALAEARKAVEVNPNDSWAIGLVGLALDLLGRHAEGLEHLERAIALLPRDPHVRFYLALGARSLIVAGDYAKAEDWARRAVAFDPGQARPHMMLAIALAARGHLPEARAALATCERIEPGCAARWAGANEYADQAANGRIVDGLRLIGT